jgi:hypothetical protein
MLYKAGKYWQTLIGSKIQKKAHQAGFQPKTGNHLG